VGVGVTRRHQRFGMLPAGRSNLRSLILAVTVGPVAQGRIASWIFEMKRLGRKWRGVRGRSLRSHSGSGSGRSSTASALLSVGRPRKLIEMEVDPNGVDGFSACRLSVSVSGCLVRGASRLSSLASLASDLSPAGPRTLDRLRLPARDPVPRLATKAASVWPLSGRERHALVRDRIRLGGRRSACSARHRCNVGRARRAVKPGPTLPEPLRRPG
jgi:hypothetical protein